MNRLKDETSPYLRQHADNPVHWFAWGDDAFEKARAEDKPVLLSIGYSSCHWCHVMAHESFEDDGVAGVMNDKFVNIKVDREERPDVDSIYMQAVQAMTGHGGWPLTVFLTPDGKPFFGGTYFPKEARQGMPGFVQVLEAVDDAWRERRAEAEEQGDKLVDAIAGAAQLQPSDQMLDDTPLRGAYESARSGFDAEQGGFGQAPKFPQAMALDFLLRAHVRNASPETLEMVVTSLDAMAAGGIHDHVGGGFHRYSVDGHWLVPHFEKMLYDQALLLRAYTHAFQVTGEERFRKVAEGIAGYVLRDLRHDAGGFYSSEDADSEGVEGKFYVWRLDEVRRVCGDDADAVISWFQMTPQGNFEGANIPYAAERGALTPPEVERAIPQLFEAREERVRPGLDDKVLAAWNGLFADALAEAGRVLGHPEWIEAAGEAVQFVLDEMRPEGRLHRSWQADGGTRHLAYAEDHAALLEALVTLAEVDDVAWLGEARWVADQLLELFHDPDAGGFFTNGSDAESLVVRNKDLFDNASPSENSLAAHGLFRLGHLTGDTRYGDAAVGVLRLVADVLSRQPLAFSYLLGALERHLTSPLEIAVVGPEGDQTTRALTRATWDRLLPAALRITAAPGADGAHLTPLLEGRGTLDGHATAYVCEHFACQQPVTDVDALNTQIDEALTRR